MGTIYEPNLDNLSGAEKVFFRKVLLQIFRN